jgi:hypothetical protein
MAISTLRVFVWKQEPIRMFGGTTAGPRSTADQQQLAVVGQ